MFDDILSTTNDKDKLEHSDVENSDFVYAYSCPICGSVNLTIHTFGNGKVTLYCVNCNFLWNSD